MSCFCHLLPALFLLFTASIPAMSFQMQAVPIRQVIGAYGFPERTVALADSLEIAYVDAGKGKSTLILSIASAATCGPGSAPCPT